MSGKLVNVKCTFKNYNYKYTIHDLWFKIPATRSYSWHVSRVLQLRLTSLVFIKVILSLQLRNTKFRITCPLLPVCTIWVTSNTKESLVISWLTYESRPEYVKVGLKIPGAEHNSIKNLVSTAYKNLFKLTYKVFFKKLYYLKTPK